ncbi:MAG TPA: S8 family serine peptidase [Actinomycetota bacterium]|nr:S8 family serine peptidase [Actinomycetota bacterium]
MLQSRRLPFAALALLTSLFSLALVHSPGAATASPRDPEHDSEHILVGWDRSLPEQARADVHERMNGEVANRLAFVDVDVVEVPENQDPAEWVARYERHPHVAFAELNYRADQRSVPSDTLFGDQWGFHNTAQSVKASLVRGVADWDIDAPEAWDLAFGPGSFPTTGGTRVAVIDSGIDRAHVDLMEKVKACASAVAVVGVLTNGTCSDDNFHGTHVAGTVAAVTGNGLGVAGTAPNAELAICKALNASGYGFIADIVACIDWSWNAGGARIINMSLGSTAGTDTLARAVKAAHGAGILVVAASGNTYDGDLNYPAAYAEVMSVASYNQAGVVSVFTSCNSDVEIAAPGEDVWSSFPENTYGIISGTSMAAPHVAGAAALVMSEQALTATQVRSKLKTTAVAGLSTGGRKECASYPALNLANALR